MRRCQLTGPAWWRGLLLAAVLLQGGGTQSQPDQAADSAAAWSDRFARQVHRRLDVPLPDQQAYIVLLQRAMAEAGLPDSDAQAFVLVDRSIQVQAAFIILRTPAGGWHWVGASPVSTGRSGGFDHFITPVGVFAHTLANPDFRAEGTYNENRIRGYGVRGMRVFDFGWVLAERGWGSGGMSAPGRPKGEFRSAQHGGTPVSPMRLQMHATDPDLLEPRLGRTDSKGCIRIPAALNDFLDRHGLLDADYEQAQARGERLWQLRPDRQPIDWPGRYLVIVDSQAGSRPPWSPLPGTNTQPKSPRAADAARTSRSEAGRDAPLAMSAATC